MACRAPVRICTGPRRAHLQACATGTCKLIEHELGVQPDLRGCTALLKGCRVRCMRARAHGRPFSSGPGRMGRQRAPLLPDLQKASCVKRPCQRRDSARARSTFKQRSGTTRMPARASASSSRGALMPLCSQTTCVRGQALLTGTFYCLQTELDLPWGSH